MCQMQTREWIQEFWVDGEDSRDIKLQNGHRDPKGYASF